MTDSMCWIGQDYWMVGKRYSEGMKKTQCTGIHDQTISSVQFSLFAFLVNNSIFFRWQRMAR